MADVEMHENNHCGDSNATFTSSQGQILVAEKKYTIRALKMNGSTMVFFSATEAEFLDQMAVAMQMPQGGEIIATAILGSTATTQSRRLAEQLSKRFGRQFFVSCNVKEERLITPLMEKKFIEYVHTNQEQFV